ncbi:hypothetical protein [Aureimonas jatrophae]|uniref:hypothetical protein n=1 Tax=Aureimonas jatrophae TaxID=1166073 RepID=UPI00147C01A8|nr:hypothetical protein [Aureimonas jatrophae]
MIVCAEQGTAGQMHGQSAHLQIRGQLQRTVDITVQFGRPQAQVTRETGDTLDDDIAELHRIEMEGLEGL